MRSRWLAIALLWLLVLGVRARGESPAPPVIAPHVEFEKLTIRHLFDVTYTTKRQKIQSATVVAVSPKTEQAGVGIGDELMKINGKAIKGLTLAEFRERLPAHAATTYTFRKRDATGKASIREVTLMPAAKGEDASLRISH